jgi:hypothetical protein
MVKLTTAGPSSFLRDSNEITVLDVPVNSATSRYPDKRKRREKN